MFEISDISVDYHSLTMDENYIFVTDLLKPIISYQVISDRRDTSLRSACIKMNQWKKNTDEQREIVYEGEPLHPFSNYEITITAEDDEGNTARRRSPFKQPSWGANGIQRISSETNGGRRFILCKMYP